MAAIPLVLLGAVTMMLHKGGGDGQSTGKDKLTHKSLAVVSLAGAVALVSVLSLWAMVSNASLRLCPTADQSQNFIPRPFPAVFTSKTHTLSLMTACLAYWLPLNFPASLSSKHSLRFRTTRDHVALLGSIFAFQAFVFRPQPNQLDSFVIGPLALVTLALYEPPLPPLKEEAQGVSRFRKYIGHTRLTRSVALSYASDDKPILVPCTTTSSGMEATPPDHP